MVKKFLTALILLLFFPLSAYPQSKVSAGYDHFFTQGTDYGKAYFNFNLNVLGNNAMLNYERIDGRNSQYNPLQRVMLGYYYMGSNHMFGAIAASASDKPFNTIETTTMLGFYGYSIYSKTLGKEVIPLPNGEVFEYERKTALYVGAGVSREPIVFGGYFLPVFSYLYQGEHWHFTLGLPMTSIAFIPDKSHRFIYVIGFQGNGAYKYEFRPTAADKFTFEYVNLENAYRLSDVVIKKNDRDSRLIYKEEWLKFDYSHMFTKNITVSAGYAMMTGGYYFSGKYYHAAPSRRLESIMKYGISAEFKL